MPGLAVNAPDTILGYPYVINQAMASPVANTVGIYIIGSRCPVRLQSRQLPGGVFYREISVSTLETVKGIGITLALLPFQSLKSTAM